jgi:ectoine hydroxylase-related dioxygenase (phytanoyl-CoA dioxygenase family)
MLAHDVLKHPARAMSEAKRAQFFEEGCCVLEAAVPADWLARVRAAMARMVEESRAVAASDTRFVLEDGHSAATPRLRRLNSPPMHDPDFWAFAAESVSADVAADVCGPDVKFYHSKLNFKWPEGGQRFDWHQDIQAWPHTDYSPVTVGLYMEDCGPEQGPLLAIRGSHKGKLYSMYDRERNWVLRIPEDELPTGWQDDLVALTGPAGSLVLLNCRVIHGSKGNRSERMRPLLLNVYSSADSFAYVANPIPSPQAGAIVRGQPARFSSHDPEGCEMPPDWSKGYAGPWAYQNRGKAAAE